MAAGYFVVFALALLFLSYGMMQSWEFLGASYGTILLVTDLTPNIGLFWYFVIEVFDHFRALFLFVFQYHIVIYVIPLTIRLQYVLLFSSLYQLADMWRTQTISVRTDGCAHGHHFRVQVVPGDW